VTTVDLPIQMRREDISDADLAMIRSARIVAWDIETSGLDWSSERIGTCQLHVPEVGTIVLQIDGHVPDRLASVLGDPDVTKVFHHAMFDLRFMATHWKVSPANIACTKIASKLLEPHADQGDHSLKELLRRRLSVTIEKDQRLSNWLKNDLSEDQVRYAASDVIYLLSLYRDLRSSLRGLGLSDLYDRCLSHLPTRVELETGGFGDVYTY
jgi:ribonuclease D